MDEFLKQARKHIEDIDLEKALKDIDLRGIDIDQLKHLDLSSGAKKLRKQLQQLERQKREEDAASEGFVGGLLLGLIVGAILALIFAPRKGSETRELVAGTASDLKHKAEDLVGQSKDDEVAGTDDLSASLPDEPAIERDFGTTDRPNSSVL
ncbi:MAG TPA: YtxH domain-containing protein [Thermomicrobiales bacterium]|jgi:hypothetical protein|nr:YtxH domain-containing protein [Thermomicrobiales bacterium]